MGEGNGPTTISSLKDAFCAVSLTHTYTSDFFFCFFSETLNKILPITDSLFENSTVSYFEYS